MGRTAKYPFRTLEVGEHFFAPNVSIRSSASQYSKKLGRQFKVTQVKEDGNNHYKVGRTS